MIFNYLKKFNIHSLKIAIHYLAKIVRICKSAISGKDPWIDAHANANALH